MHAGYPTVTPRPTPRSWFVALVVALALALVVGVAPAALAAPKTSPVTEKASHTDPAPSAAREVPSSTVPLLLAGIVVLALLTPSPPRHRSGYGSNHSHY